MTSQTVRPAPGRRDHRRALGGVAALLLVVTGTGGGSADAAPGGPAGPARPAVASVVAAPPSAGPPRPAAAAPLPGGEPTAVRESWGPPPLGYRETALRTPTGQPFMSSMSGNPINQAGRVAGWTEVRGDGTVLPRAAVFDLGSLTLRVLRPPGSTSSMALDVNDHGDVSGTAEYRGGSQAFLWTESTNTYRLLGTLDGSAAYGFALNDRGVVVGRASRADGREHAFIADPAVDGGRMRDLGVLGQDESSGATGLNERGDVVGWSAAPQQPSRAVVWRAGAGVATDIGTLPWANAAVANAINDRGFIVGASGFTPPVGEPGRYRPGRAFLLNPLTGQLRQLPGGEDGAETLATAINVHGLVVGSSYGQTQRPLLWNSCGTPVQELARNQGFSYAVGINRHERVLGADASVPTVWRRNGACG